MPFAESQYVIDEVLTGHTASDQTGLPSNCLVASVTPGNRALNLYFELKDSVLGGGVMLSRIGGVIVRIKKDTKPETPNDGELIGDFDRSFMTTYKTEPYVINNLEEGAVYWIRCFPYSDHNVISYADNWSFRNEIKGYHIFGFHQDFTNLDPETCITYIADNKDWTPIRANHSYPDQVTMGNWNQWAWLSKVRPFMIKQADCEVDYALDPSDYRKKLDGSDSNITNINYPSDAYVWFPKLFIKEVYAADGNSRDVYFTESREFDETSDFNNIVFYNRNNTEVEGMWIAMYYDSSAGKYDNIGYPSKANQQYNGYDYYGSGSADAHNSIIARAYKRTTVGNHHIGFVGGSFVNLLRDLEYMLFRTTNIQTALGTGYRRDEEAGTFACPSSEAVFTSGLFYGLNTLTPAKAFHSVALASYCLPLGGNNKTLDPERTWSIPGSFNLNTVTIVDPELAKISNLPQSSTRYNFFSSKMIYTTNGSIPICNNNGSVTTGFCDCISVMASRSSKFKTSGGEMFGGPYGEDYSQNQPPQYAGPTAWCQHGIGSLAGTSHKYWAGIVMISPNLNYTPYD